MQPATLRRHGQRGTYDLKSVKDVFDDCFISHVSYAVDGLPACMPMIALIMEDPEADTLRSSELGERLSNGANEDLKNGIQKDGNTTFVYLHGHPSTKLMELVREANRRQSEDVQSTTETNGQIANNKSLGEVKVCITATKVDGLVLSSAPNGHTFNYRSATIHGTCEPVSSKTTKHAVMRAVTQKIVANRWEEVNPVASMQVSLVYVVKVHIDALSVKSRTGIPGIQPRNKEKDGPDIQIPPWTGVIPLWEELGTPVDSGLTPNAVVSGNLKAYIETRNERQQAYSKKAASS
ncbi:unnamed protein product [Clonostachys rosea f. rosea IK726]|uniref:Uncharacterized protein n=1 Tax=Clonostachys rosea f. rosea IK726 TaxID=1349383 RepID=A0ACA9TL17_BIOOC|nr:unnamed protein product [Clonostachys rosea f. rosea IK726]